MTSAQTTAQTIVQTRPTGRQRRGRETALDMVRSLGVVFLLVLPLWFFGQASPSDSKRIRPVDPTGAFHDFTRATGGPVPSATPHGWIPNVSDYTTVEGVLRVGYVVGDHYLEYAGGLGTAFLEGETGKGRPTATVDVAGTRWQLWRSADGAHESLVRTAGRTTVCVGGVRETASRADLLTLAATVR
ncbi:MAG: DUF4245 domain-containing protein [Mycobacteriales bacterium]